MQEGFILDLTRGGQFPSIWVEGKPESEKISWFSAYTGVNTDGKTKYLISVYRCEKCGLLKSYAIYGRTNK